MKLFILNVFLLVFQNNYAQNETDLATQQLFELRKEVEILNANYKSKRESYLTDLKSISMQKAEIESQIRHESLRMESMRNTFEELQKKMGELKKTDSDRYDAITNLISYLKKYIQTGLPVKLESRLEQLEKIEKDVKNVTSNESLQKLWLFIEDEKTLVKESSIFNQVVNIKDKQFMATMLKIGMFRLYFQLKNGDKGIFVKKSNMFIPVLVDDDYKNKEIDRLYSAFKKQIKQGPFSFPGI